MIQQVEHTATRVGPADLALALAVADALHTPTAPSRAPELATAGLGAGHRAAAARGRRRTVRG
ncbi:MULTISPECIES: hypothetical protein [unclassified Streptomyces]|uniref:hypothetical protein n=1 Tax=unclassified Streptomyces TaxID=2593676 RepID=UPI002366D479|nr:MULTISPECIES: hypothetical protein [unclassified Streptomyces]MDF3142898.1 hypothetical protein [Streptomyces sp. T21Q-yed]WDF39293.1 hypothetical protein PBV52_22045 [Streptomyces sp. T12]